MRKTPIITKIVVDDDLSQKMAVFLTKIADDGFNHPKPARYTRRAGSVTGHQGRAQPGAALTGTPGRGLSGKARSRAARCPSQHSARTKNPQIRSWRSATVTIIGTEGPDDGTLGPILADTGTKGPDEGTSGPYGDTGRAGMSLGSEKDGEMDRLGTSDG